MEDAAENSLTLLQIYQAIVQGIQAANPMADVQFWPVFGETIPDPSILLSLLDLKPGTDMGTGKTPLIARFQARVVVDELDRNGPQKATHLAATLTTLLHNQDWGLPIGMAEFVRSGWDAFSPELQGCTVWLVEWTHEFCLGETEWPFEDSTGKVLYLGFDPETGPGNEDKYLEIGQPPPDSL